MMQRYCETCGKTLTTRKQKRFCCLACYILSPDFQKKAVENGKKKAGKVCDHRSGEMGNCLNCAAPIYIPPKYKDRQPRKYCNKACYREFMAKRFDRHIDSSTPINQPQCYDEFLGASVIACLVEGCDWTGHKLALHMNMAHGIKAAEAKEAGGFNRHTGLISTTHFRMLSAAQKNQNHNGRLIRKPSGVGPSGAKLRPEGAEHRIKSKLVNVEE